MPLSLSHIERTIQHNKLVLTHGEGLTHNDLTLRNARLPGHAQHTDTVQRMVTQQMDGRHATNGHAMNGHTTDGHAAVLACAAASNYLPNNLVYV